jgi:hypothetical protein
MLNLSVMFRVIFSCLNFQQKRAIKADRYNESEQFFSYVLRLESKNSSSTADKQTMKISEKYYAALQDIGDWTTVSDWATRVGELYPDLLAKADKEAEKQKLETTGLREIAARISSRLSRGSYSSQVEIDESERPRRVRPLDKDEVEQYIEKETEEDIAPLKRSEKIKIDLDKLDVKEKYRLSEFDSIVSQLRSLFRLNFELEHSKALMNPDDPGTHHPDNLQVMTKHHNGSKNNQNWDRFSLEEQVDYIRAEVRLQKIVASRMGIIVDESILDQIFERLKAVF